MRMNDKVAVITGATQSNGIGYATAKAIAREGAKVILTGQDANALQERVREFTHDGLSAISFGHDVASEKSWAELLSIARSTYGKINILVNNAGLSLRHPIDLLSLADWHRVVDVNLTGVFLGCRMAVGAMREQGGGGAIVNVSSIGAMKAFQKSGAYGASKAGVRQLTRIVALEGAKDNIRCNAVYPGLIGTKFIREASEDQAHMKALFESIPFGRMGAPEEVAKCIVFLASSDSSYVSGAELVVDGGLLTR
jgi:NAD(P)-dependent dehydrogenase (short-subunit alcohol dehydrogenase family)